VQYNAHYEVSTLLYTMSTFLTVHIQQPTHHDAAYWSLVAQQDKCPKLQVANIMQYN